jgi:predicted nucleic acid-binding protein
MKTVARISNTMQRFLLRLCKIIRQLYNICMNILSDTNIFLAVALDEPEKSQIIQLTSQTNIIAPKILPYEIGNALSAMIKRKQLTKHEALEAQKIVERIPVRLVDVDIQAALELAIDFNIYAYDAYFIQCAKSFSIPLLTLDRKMQQVASQLNITILKVIK